VKSSISRRKKDSGIDPASSIVLIMAMIYKELSSTMRVSVNRYVPSNARMKSSIGIHDMDQTAQVESYLARMGLGRPDDQTIQSTVA
jgi:hypothetical protein